VSGQALNARSRRARRAPRPVLLLAVAGLMILLAACSGTRTGKPSANASPSPTGPTATTNPNFIRLVVPPGPVQNGSVDAKSDWVTPFEEQSGCLVELRSANTDADAYKDLTYGIGNSYYDGILASPEVAGQLMQAKAVAPLDTTRITGYSGVSPRLRTAAPEVSGTTTYGLPYLWDSYVTGYDVGQVKPAPKTWTALFSPASAAQHSGKITVPNAPVTLALAALYLKSAQPSLGITDPFELTKSQLTAVQQAVNAVRPHIGTYWDADSTVIGQLGDGQDVLGAVLTHQINEMTRAGLPTAGVPPLTQAAGSGTTVAYMYSWMVSAHAHNPSCAYKWLSWMTSNYVQERAAAFTSAAPVTPAACRGPAAANCTAYHMSTLPTARNLVFEHLPMANCSVASQSGTTAGTATTQCTTYAQWQADWLRVTNAAGIPQPSATDSTSP
jgi:putative spermidine/putrescine transport system substrate-binding protein